MNKSVLFNLAHKLARKTIQAGDNYRVTFGACLKMIISMSNKYKANLGLLITKGFDGMVYRPTPKGVCVFLTNKAQGTEFNLTNFYASKSKAPSKFYLNVDGYAKSYEMSIIIATLQAAQAAM